MFSFADPLIFGRILLVTDVMHVRHTGAKAHIWNMLKTRDSNFHRNDGGYSNHLIFERAA